MHCARVTCPQVLTYVDTSRGGAPSVRTPAFSARTPGSVRTPSSSRTPLTPSSYLSPTAREEMLRLEEQNRILKMKVRRWGGRKGNAYRCILIFLCCPFPFSCKMRRSNSSCVASLCHQMLESFTQPCSAVPLCIPAVRVRYFNHVRLPLPPQHLSACGCCV